MAKNAGRFLGNDFIEKPFVIEDLEKRIDKALQK
jgi:FixJ family two-component response regulator